MKRLLDLSKLAAIVAFLALLGIGLAGQTAKATGGGGGDGDGDGDSSASRSAESSAPPPGFLGLQMALASFHRNAIFLSPEEATARLLIHLSFAPLIDLVTALQFHQLYGAPKGNSRPTPKAPVWRLDEQIKVSLRYQPRCNANTKASGTKPSTPASTGWDSNQAPGEPAKACSDDFLAKTSNLFGPAFGEFLGRYGSDKVKNRRVIPNLIYVQGFRPEDVQSPEQK